MKKIISIILAVVMTATMSVYADFLDVEKPSDAIDTITGLGLMDGYTDGTFQPENNMTRAEFASVIAGIYNYGEIDDAVEEWKQSFFKDVEEEIKLIEIENVVQVQEIYTDVTDTDEYYDDIILATQYGLMVGIGDNMFDPDGSMTGEQAVKVIVSMLGYAYEAEMSGGYPNGYVGVASRLGLLKNVVTDGYMTRGMAAQLLFNALEIDLMQYNVSGQRNSGFKAIEGENVLTMLLNLEKKTGRMTDDGYTAFSQISAVGEAFIVVDGLELSVDENHEYARNYLGREVEVYYTKEDAVLMFACLTERDTAVEIQASEFVAYSDNIIEYLPAEGSKEKSIRLNTAATVIENGTAKETYDETVFDFNYGTITVVTPRGERSADLILIKKYVNFNIDYVDTANEKIFSKSSLLGNAVDLMSDDKRVKIYNESGAMTDITGLLAGMVTTICQSDTLVEVYITQKVVENAKVTEIRYNDYGEMVVTSKGVEYILSKDYIDANKDAELIKINTTYTFNLDMFGNIVRFTKVAGDEEIGFITKIIKIDDGEVERETLMLTYYDVAATKLEKTYLPEEFTLIYENDEQKTAAKKVKGTKNFNDVYDIISAYIVKNGERMGGLCRYSINEEGDITRLELAGNQKISGNEDNRLVKIELDTASYKGNVYASGNIGGKVIITNSAKIIACNYKSDSFDTDNGFTVGTRALFRDDEEMDNVMVYTTQKDSPVAEYVVYTKDVSKYITTKLPHTVGIVRKIHEGIDENDMPVKIIFMDEGNIEYTVVDNALEPGNVMNVQGSNAYVDASGGSHLFEVEPGDIIRYGLDQDGNINLVQLLYDTNADYSEGFTINSNTYSNYKNVKGALAGCLDHWEDNLYTHSNPYSVSYNESTGKYDFSEYGYAWMTYSDTAMRVMLGYALSGDSSYVKTTTQPLNISQYDETKAGYVTNTWAGASATLIDLENKEPKVSKISLSQIRTYETTGLSCDRVLVTSRIGNPSNIIVIRGTEK